MNIDIAVAFLIIMIVVFSVAYGLGWDQSVKKWRASDRNRGLYIQDLDNQIAAFNRQKDEDPQRAWVDVGIIHAINSIESVSEELRADVNKRREPPNG